MYRGKVVGRLCVALFASLLFSCSAGDREAMPISRENILAYKAGLVETLNNITDKERRYVVTAPDKAAKVFRATYVKPLEKLGYDYDKTVSAIARALIDNKVPGDDPEVKVLAEGMIIMAKGTEPFAAKHGFISAETKKLLDQINIKEEPVTGNPASPVPH